MSGFYNWNMSRQPRFDWFLSDWLSTLELSQTDLQRKAGWSKRKASTVCSGEQRYNRDIINEVSAALNVMPFELLLHPADAMAIRKMREGGIQLAAEAHEPFAGFEEDRKSAGAG